MSGRGQPEVFAVGLGFGSCLLLDAGRRIVTTDRRGRERVRGSWSLMVELAAWRLRRGRSIIAASQDPRDTIESNLSTLVGRRIKRVKTTPVGDCSVILDGRCTIEIFVDTSADYEPWVLWTSPTRTKTFRPRNTQKTDRGPHQ